MRRASQKTKMSKGTAEPHLQVFKFSSKYEFDSRRQSMMPLVECITGIENKMAEDHPSGTFHFSGYCAVCGDDSEFTVDYLHGFGGRPNYRERIVCPTCRLNGRMRASIHLLETTLHFAPNDQIYITEQMTPLFSALRQRFPSIVGSEYLSDGTRPGCVNTTGIRHEDMTKLSFANGIFDAVLSFECLEHVPNYKVACSECRRILRSGGRLFLTAPFRLDSAETITRARLRGDGTIEHHEPAEYHGDPVNKDGILCYYHFGWSLLNDMKAAGFSSASVLVLASPRFGYLGGLQHFIIAEA